MSENNKITTNLGRVSIVPRGEYDPKAAYLRLDLVQHRGASYLALHELTGVTPSDGEDWMLVAEKGDTGAGIWDVELTHGNHAAGTMDTYTIRFENGDTRQFQVYNGADGLGAGDMMAAVYDPEKHNTDIFAYVDRAVSGVDLSGYYTKEQTDGRIEEAATPSFTQAAARANIAGGEKLSVLFGKIQKWFADLKTVAFSGAYSDLSGTPTSLKNPQALTFTGSVTGDYDGSAAKTVNIPTAYSLPLAASGTRGGVKTGYAANGRNYPVLLSNEQMYVNVPWTDTTYNAATQSAAGLMSVADKKKLDGLSGWTLLWSNSSPASAFAAQTLSIPGLSNYSFLMVIGSPAGDGPLFSSLLPVNNPASPATMFTLRKQIDGNAMTLACRTLTIGSNAVTFSTGTQFSTANSKLEGDTYAIPHAIYGI